MGLGYNPAGLWTAKGGTFCQGVVQHPGQVVHVTGQVAWDAQDRLIGAGDTAAQMEQCIQNIKTVLAEIGGTLDDVVALTIYFLDQSQRPAIQAVRERHFFGGRRPAGTLVMVAGLVEPDLLIELVPTAVVPHERYRAPQSAIGAR